MELIAEPSINATAGVSMVIMLEPCWMDPIIDFLIEDRVSGDEKEASRVRRVATRYWLSQIVNYTRGLLGGHISYACVLKRLVSSW